jgi:high-affinity iron transporter
MAAAVFNAGMHYYLLEAIVILAAAALMLYVSGWLMVKQDPRGWNDYLATRADSALAQDTAWAVAALAFFAVFREGAETVLFIHALAVTEGGWSAGLFAGLAAATVGLVVLFYFINLVARRIPLRPLFIVTSAFLFVMGVKFIGEAVSIGFNPTLEAVSAQAVVILLALATFAVVWRNARRGYADKAAKGAVATES